MATLASPLRLAALALQLSGCRPSSLQVALELGDAAHDPPPVDLELGLAAAEPGADAAALLRQVGVRAAPQARQPVAQQRQLDLRLALERVGVLGEDVEDHRGAVDRRAAEQLLEVELLGRRQLVVEHDGVGVDGEAQLACSSSALPLPMNHVWSGRVAALHDAGRRRRRRRCRPAAASSSRLASTSLVGRRRAGVTPTSTICSRIDRSISVAPSASWYGVRLELFSDAQPCRHRIDAISMVATYVAGPVSVTRPGRRVVERHCGTTAVHVHHEFPVARRRQSPAARRRTPRRRLRCRTPR